MKKKLLFILPSFGIGGTTVSTINLISLLDSSKYEFSVLCLSGEGMLKGMYSDVSQIKTDFIAHSLSLTSWHNHNGSISKLIVMLLRYVSNHSRAFKTFLIRHSIKSNLRDQKFDTVISCQEGITTEYVSNIACNNKIAWVRCDYKRYLEESKMIPDDVYFKFNSIVCVARKLCDDFKHVYPDIANKVICINNPQNAKMIIDAANGNDHDIRFINDIFTIVSVGRFSPVKRFTKIPSIARQLLDDGVKFRWYIVGDGEEERIALEKNINDFSVNDIVILLGYKSNPHYYISKADLLVCLSYSEACPRIIDEAKILGIPTVSTDFPTIYEFIENGKDGIITSIDDISQSIKLMITDKTVYEKCKKTISGYKFDNKKLINQIETIL